MTVFRKAFSLPLAVVFTVASFPFWVASAQGDESASNPDDQLYVGLNHNNKAMPSWEHPGELGTADTESKLVPVVTDREIPSPPHQMPCPTAVFSNGKMLLDSCDPPPYGGYSYGWQVKDMPHQRICFESVSSVQAGKEAQPSGYMDPNTRDRAVADISAADWGKAHSHPDLKWDERLVDAAARYSDQNPGPNIRVRAFEDERNFRVATIDDYRNAVPTNKSSAWVWNHSLSATVTGARAGDPYSVWRGVSLVEPAKIDWSRPKQAFNKKVTWSYTEHYQMSGYRTRTAVFDSNGRFVRHEYSNLESNIRTISVKQSEYTKPISTAGLRPGLGASTYIEALKDKVRAQAIPPRPTPPSVPRCHLYKCSNKSSVSYHGREVEEPTPVVDGAATGTFPSFWKVWELFGVLTDRTPLDDYAPAAIDDLVDAGIERTYLEHAYHIDYYSCWVGRNGKPLDYWEVLVPWPWQAPKGQAFSAVAAKGDEFISPRPQSIPGLETELLGRSSRDRSALVHVPISLFDEGSGIKGGTTAGPDGNWWATVGSPTGFGDCIIMSGKVPVCLAVSLRPWRAVWYIEPPPAELRNPSGNVPTPRDVRVCAYSNGALDPFGANLPLERRNLPSGGKSHYQVVVDPGTERAMMHTLGDAALQDKRNWLEQWLYGSGRSRLFGQDQGATSDQWCWYAWYQAQNDPDGFQGLVSVEWLGAAFLGAPTSSDYYCLSGKDKHLGTTGDLNGGFMKPVNNCSVQKDRSSHDSRDWFETVVDQWNNGPTDFTLDWLGERTTTARTCYAGSRSLDNLPGDFDWYLQAVSVIYENDQEAGPSSLKREPMHPLGGLDPSASGGIGRSPAKSTPNQQWWNSGSSHPAATPQAGDGQGRITSHAHSAKWRTYSEDVVALHYPDSLNDTSLYPECGGVPVTVVGLPCKDAGCQNRSWYRLFGTYLENGVTKEKDGNLWAWWGQQVSEMTQRVTPVPVG